MENLSITKVDSAHEAGIIDLLMQSFPGKDFGRQESHFHFLNYENPTQYYSPMGLVAVHEGMVVGYLGFIALPFLIGERKLKILIPHSTATHFQYRRKGISKKIFEKSLDLYSEEFVLFLGTSYTRLSIKGRLKEKWKILANKEYLFKINFSLYKRKRRNYDISFEREVPSDSIKYIFENSVFSKDSKIRLDLNSTEFVNWIFNREGYKWAVLRIKEEAMAYCCFTVSKDKCNLIYFDMICNDQSLKILLREISNKYSLKTFYYFCSDNESMKREFIRKLGFWSTSNDLIRKIMGKELFPILIRPTVKDYDSPYFTTYDVNLSDRNNWDITKLINF